MRIGEVHADRAANILVPDLFADQEGVHQRPARR
jgi:hypothetical protein